jgi:hypothetical protein
LIATLGVGVGAYFAVQDRAPATLGAQSLARECLAARAIEFEAPDAVSIDSVVIAHPDLRVTVSFSAPDVSGEATCTLDREGGIDRLATAIRQTEELVGHP